VSALIKIRDSGRPAGHLCNSCTHGSHRLEDGRLRYFCELRAAFTEEVRGSVSQCSSYLADEEAGRGFNSLAYILHFDSDHEPVWMLPSGAQVPKPKKTRRERAV